MQEPDNHYQHPALAAVYDVTSGWDTDRDYYLSLAGRTPMDVLDIGCGTGLLCNAYAEQGHRVVGVDPAGAMLQEARQKPNGSRVQWLEAYGHNFETTRRFDLAIMTGHAFQTLLSDTDILALFRNVHRHLKRDGRFVFETRNPAMDWRSRWHGRSGRCDSAAGPYDMATRVLDMSGETITFEHVYTFADQTLKSRSTLRFPDRDAVNRLLRDAGFSVDGCYGDWQAGPFVPDTSDEIIFDARRRQSG